MRFSREAIVKAGVQCVQSEGYEALSIRKVAQAFEGSPQPIYSHFKTREALVAAVLERILEMFQDCMNRKFSEHAFLNMGVGAVVFAREQPALFRCLCLNPVFSAEMIERILSYQTEALARSSQFPSFGRKQLRDLVARRWVYVYGLATLVSLNLFKDPSDKNILRNIKASGLPVLADAQRRATKGTDHE
jgi:AcrR family transcriptional regulator